MLIEWHFLKYADYKDVKEKKKVKLSTLIQSMFQGLRFSIVSTILIEVFSIGSNPKPLNPNLNMNQQN
jgi:hypothetical protein